MWRGNERRVRRVLRGLRLPAEILAYLFWLLVDGLSTLTDLPYTIAVPVTGVVAATVVLFRGRIGRDRAAVLVCGLSILVTVASWPFGTPPLVFTEQLALAVVTISVLHRVGRPGAWRFAVLSGVAIVGSAAVRPELGGTREAFLALSVMGWIGAAAIGLALREARSRRVAELADARSSERMDLARELHDVVAHHVTGIVVAAQAAGVVARNRPEEVGPALESIERAGTDALTAMRSMVGVLRERDGAERTTGPDLGGVPELVRRFDDGRGTARLHADAGLEHAVLPAGVAASGYRIVQEALTNVRRHAPRAATVEVELRMSEETLQVTVRNDGVEPTPGPAPGRGGFGLAGMSERVAALGGDLRAGPAGPGVWTVSARLPVSGG